MSRSLGYSPEEADLDLAMREAPTLARADEAVAVLADHLRPFEWRETPARLAVVAVQREVHRSLRVIFVDDVEEEIVADVARHALDVCLSGREPTLHLRIGLAREARK